MSAGGRAHLLHGDISQPGTVDRLLEQTVTAFGRLDILINNAGDLIRRYPVAETPDDFFDAQIATNVKPVFVACRGAVGQFRKQGGGGVIINLSSIAARTGGGGGSSLYAASKAFVATFTRALAKEVAGEASGSMRYLPASSIRPCSIARPRPNRLRPSSMPFR